MHAGPATELAPLLEALKGEGVFVRELDTLGIAYHSPALDAFGAELHTELAAVLAAPKPRSMTWLSTCYPLDSEDPAAALCGPEYHVCTADQQRATQFSSMVKSVHKR